MRPLPLVLTDSTVQLAQGTAEATWILGLRATLGDERAADYLFGLPNDPGFVLRNTHQLSSLFDAKYKP